VHLIDDERENSAGFLLACPVAQRGTAEFEAGIALSKMLSRSWRASGSPFASRPSSEIVESAGSAHLTVQFAAGSDDAAAAVTAVLKRLDGFRHPTASMDLDALRRERTFSLMSDCDSANAEANLVARLTALGLTGGTLGTEYDNAARLSGGTVQVVAQGCFAPAAMLVVGYGRVRAAAEELRKGGFGPIDMRNAPDGGTR
jgi:hypothetical protein